jgi:hypothetical protein
VKQERFITEAQLRPIKYDLAFLFKFTHQLLPTFFNVNAVRPQSLIQINAVTAVRAHLLSDAVTTKKRRLAGEIGVGPERLYMLALLYKKICVWMAARQSISSGDYAPPSSIESWVLIEATCKEYVKKRRMGERTRMA